MISVESSKSEGYRFKVMTTSGSTLLQSVSFNTKKELQQTVSELSVSPTTPGKVERKTNNDGKFLFQLKNNAGKVLGTSGLYSSEAGMENGIKNLYKNLNFS